MKSLLWITAAALLSGCAALGLGGTADDASENTWSLAHQALAAEDFPRAAALFQRLVDEHPEEDVGRESVFFLGAMRLDPRNPAWDSEPAESLLRQYVGYDSVAQWPVIGRRPEAEVLLQLASQLNMPAEARVPALQPETRVVVRTRPERVVVPAAQSRELAAEVATLRRQLAERDETIRTQREELERIRKTLTGREGGRSGGR